MNRRAGFTLIELLVVMTIVATLLAIAVPRYFGSVDRSKEATLRQSLLVMRDAIDKFAGDTGAYPETLAALVEKGYLRSIPVDPLTESATGWVVVPPPDSKKTGVYDVHSGAEGSGQDGRPYKDW